MKEIVDLILENVSSRELFRFQVRCSECGEVYAGKPVRFSKAGIVPESEGKKIIYDTMYDQEFAHARMDAVRGMAEHMNLCPVCKRVVCNRCFLICEDLDLCSRCAVQLDEEGNPVLSDVFEIVR